MRSMISVSCPPFLPADLPPKRNRSWRPLQAVSQLRKLGKSYSSLSVGFVINSPFCRPWILWHEWYNTEEYFLEVQSFPHLLYQ